jgi:ubiquinone biosynthesis protein COQ9
MLSGLRFCAARMRSKPLRTVISNLRFSTENISSDKRNDIMLQALKYVPTLGWSEECLVKAAHDLGLPSLSHRIVGRGAPELVQFVLSQKREYVREHMNNLSAASTDASSEKIDSEVDTERLQVSLEKHLEYLLPYKSHWAEAMALCVQPSELPHTIQSLFLVLDDFCSYGSIRNAREDWYTERVLLTLLYGSAELFFLTDQTADLADTR